MLRKLIAISTLVVFFASSCKNTEAPAPVKPVETTTINKTLLTGWWAPVEQGKANIYFGEDNFFYQDILMRDLPEVSDDPIPGFWRLSAADIIISATANGQSTANFTVQSLSAKELKLKTGNIVFDYVKLNQPAITSPAISTIVGNGTEGNSGDGGLAINATIASAAGMAFDKAGNLYFCDANSGVVRKVSAADGKISTIAGTGKQNVGPALFAEGSAATSADLIRPLGLAFDAAGNLYVSEGHFATGKVDKITPDGKIYLVAGGLNLSSDRKNIGDGDIATKANLKEPAGLAIDKDNNIYIADIQNYRIRKVSAATGKISTVAGNGESNYRPATLGDNGPATQAEINALYFDLDANNNIYIADSNHGLLRKVTASTGIITTIMGSYNAPYNSGDGGDALTAGVGYPWGLCVAPNGDVYFTNAFTWVRKIDHKTNIVSAVAGNGSGNYQGDGPHATAYALKGPFAVKVDNQGNVYIADGTRIRKVSAK